jgi:F-type H+-transporting ATPase subunit delta
MSVQPELMVQATVFDDDRTGVSRNYAEALLNVAENDGQADAVIDDLEEFVADLVVGDSRFNELFDNPAVRVETRDRLLAETFEGRAHPTLLRFLRVLNRHGRLALLPTIAHQARALWDQRQNRRPATIRSATPLDDDQRNALIERLGQMLAAAPVIRFEVDPALIGGLVVQVGDDVYDASIRNQLDLMRRGLVAGRARTDLGRFAS